MFTWTARSPPKSETKIALFVNGKETGHQLWAAKSGKQSASQTAVSTNPIVKGFISHLSYNLFQIDTFNKHNTYFVYITIFR